MPETIPLEPHLIEPNWLTEALGERFPGVRVTQVDVLERHEVTNTHARIRVSYEPSAGAPETMFCKFLPADAGRREAIASTQMGVREARFYDELAPRLAMRMPKVHVSKWREDDGMFLLLLEDLRAAGCTISDGVQCVTPDSAAVALEDLAALHVRYEDPVRRAAETPWVREPDGPREYGESRLAYGLEHHRDRLTDAFATLAERYVADSESLHRLWHEGPFTVLHGDPHIGNLFDDHGRTGFLDWGLITLSTPMRDASYFLVMAMSTDDRRAHEERLLRHYLDVRRALGGTVISFDDAWRKYREQTAYTVAACCPVVTFPEGKSPERETFSMAFLGRAEAALDDLEVVRAVGDALG